MATGDGTAKPRATGDAAWRADRDALDQRNAAVKRRAQEGKDAGASAAVERERRLEVAEAAQLKELNKRLGARAPESP